MKKAFMLLGLAAAVFAVSCTNENLKTIEPNNKTFEGDVAYIVVNINDVNDATTRATSSGFEYGSSAEYAIHDAHFYFYDSFGEYVAESSSDELGGTASSGDPTNIEFKANTVITLHGLSGTSYPNWVVTVLNQPAAFVAPIKLADFPETLAETRDGYAGTLGEYGIFSKGVGLYVDGTMYYTMSTSSFVPDQTNNGEYYDATYYFATPVTSANFSLEELTTEDGKYVGADGEEAVPVEIYVERLVAKTRMGTSMSTTDAVSVSFTYTEGEGEGAKTYTKTGYAYPIKVEEEASDGTGNLELDEDVTLYVYLDGWRLNGISTDSYISKRINTDWGADSPYDWGWNDSANYRSYWAMSTAYDDTNVTWPKSSDGDDYDAAKNTLNEYLRWVDLQQAYLKGFGDGSCEYCAENTNTAGAPNAQTAAVITSEKSVAITNALVKAFIGRYDSTTQTFTPLDLVRVGGLIYTKENYCVWAASHIHLYTRTGDAASGYVYTLLGPDDLVVVDDNDGYVHVEINPELGETILYTDTEGTQLMDTVNSYIDEHFNKIYGVGANGYTGGMMYYTIPIQHLNNDYSKTYTDDNGDSQTLVLEGNYGMVRNHIYAITITGIENIGWGIYNPEEVIIPQEDVDTYSITANINVLSWKLVEQSVTL